MSQLGTQKEFSQPQLQITSNRPAVVDDKGGFLLQFFPSLLFLEIQRVKPHLILDCAKISDQLCSLTVHESLNSLEELLDNDIEQPPSWTHLRTLDCSHNNIPFIDASMVGMLLVCGNWESHQMEFGMIAKSSSSSPVKFES